METSSRGETIGDASAAAAADLELAIAFTDPNRLDRFIPAICADPSGERPAKIGLAGAGLGALGTWRVSRVHFGNEFCERLLPSRAALEVGHKVNFRRGRRFFAGCTHAQR